MASQKRANRYPRPGERVAPTTLRQVLLETAPDRLVQGTEAAGLRLCELDESIWDKLTPEAIVELGEMVIARVAAGCTRKAFHQRRFPRPPEGLKLSDLRLEHRTHLCLAREGFEETPQALADHTIGDILAMRAFGPRCLVDLLSALETSLAGQRRLCASLTAEARRLAGLPEAALALSNDPRFSRLMHEVDVEATSVKDLADRLIARTQDPPDPLYVADRLRQLHERITAMPGKTMEEELIQVFASTSHERNQEVVIGYYGWKDGQPHTLAQIGKRYGMTRERTRQICAKLVKRDNPQAIPAPVTDRTLDFLKQRMPRLAATLEEEMLRAGLTKVGLRLENVQRAAKLLGRPVPFAVVRVGTGKLAIAPEQAGVPAAVVELAKKEIYYHGVTTAGKIESVVSKKFPGRVEPALVTETLKLMDGFRWLDEQAGWFRLVGTCKHGLPKAIDKILAVAGAITVSDLRAAVSRNRRMWREPPPEKVILEFCRQTPGVRVQGNQIIPDPPRSWKGALTGVEAKLVGILKKHGPVMERSELEDLCVGSGMNRFSFHAFIACSPVIAQYGHSIYGLLGADVAPETVRSLTDKRRAQRSPTRVLAGYGRTEDGKVWLSYRLSKAASTYAVITVPAALKNVVRGKFQLLTGDGRKVGTLGAKDGRAWGLGTFLRQCGAQTNDRILITLDPRKREAVISFDRQAPQPVTSSTESG